MIGGINYQQLLAQHLQTQQNLMMQRSLWNGGHWQTGTSLQIGAAQRAHFSNQGAFTASNLSALYAALTGVACPDEDAFEDSGIEVGEVIAWRCWMVNHGELTSVVNTAFSWPARKAVKADRVSPLAGIHAFKTQEQALDYWPCDLRYTGWAVGEVSLWGQIYEFSKGYHAEFAKVHSLKVISPALYRKQSWWRRKSPEPALTELRKAYGID